MSVSDLRGCQSVLARFVSFFRRFTLPMDSSRLISRDVLFCSASKINLEVKNVFTSLLQKRFRVLRVTVIRNVRRLLVILLQMRSSIRRTMQVSFALSDHAKEAFTRGSRNRDKRIPPGVIVQRCIVQRA